jgi:D-alanine-D-alanine ligase
MIEMINVGVLFGSRSVEHEISIITAMQAVAQLLADDNLKVVPIYITKEGDWYTGDSMVEIESFKDIPSLLRKSVRVHMVRQENRTVLQRADLKKFGSNEVATIDVAFPIVHGSYGEDGTLPGLLEHMQIPYVGCNTMSAAVTMDKIMTKLVLRSSGVSLVEDAWLYSEEWTTDSDRIIADIESKLSYPVIVKPADIGSSIGVTPAKSREELREAIGSVRFFSERILVERMVTSMREINISVLGEATDFALSVCEEPITSSEFLTYEDKYQSGSDGAKGKMGSKSSPSPGSSAESMSKSGSAGMSSLKRKLPADITDEQRKKIESMASTAYKALGCSGVLRIDFIMDVDRDEIYLNEFNTVPGSLSFYLWEATGVPFGEMLSRLISIAVRRFERKKLLTFSNKTNILATASLGGAKGAKGTKI